MSMLDLLAESPVKLSALEEEPFPTSLSPRSPSRALSAKQKKSGGLMTRTEADAFGVVWSVANSDGDAHFAVNQRAFNATTLLQSATSIAELVSFFLPVFTF